MSVIRTPVGNAELPSWDHSTPSLELNNRMKNRPLRNQIGPVFQTGRGRPTEEKLAPPSLLRTTLAAASPIINPLPQASPAKHAANAGSLCHVIPSEVDTTRVSVAVPKNRV